MPELKDDMYCSEQICIPPTFPYLLRQYAKAAIRTQPSDLLRWSSAYFRCLALSIPPPVKPRLEYPIPRDYHGLTPGWIKALLYQSQKAGVVHFKVLWDRWVGACLQHDNLIQILCLGNFTDNTAIPWLRFIALCAGFLTNSLTETMILICEILTEEPEGGSAMIPLETFLDLYKFLAKINASAGQWLPNIHFTEAILELFKKKAEEDALRAMDEETVTEESVMESYFSEEVGPEIKKKDETSVQSCPSATTDEYENIEDYLKKLQKETAEYGEGGGPDLVEAVTIDELKPAAEEGKEEKDLELDEDIMMGEEHEGEKVEEEEDIDAQFTLGGFDDDLEPPAAAKSEEAPEILDFEKSLANLIEGYAIDTGYGEEYDDMAAQAQRQMEEKLDAEIQQMKEQPCPELVRSKSVEERMGHYTSKIKLDDDSEESVKGDLLMMQPPIEDEKEGTAYELIYIDVIHGIGGEVPDELMVAAINYLTEMAHDEHGVVMPRHIRHFSCPPLEVWNKDEK